jgi:RecA-family ATPase
MAASFPEPSYVIPGIVATGLTMLVGGPKLGKSYMVRHLAHAKAHGEPAFGKITLSSAPVLLLALEDSASRVQEKMTSLLDDADPGSDDLHIYTGWETMSAGGLRTLRQFIDDHKIALVIIDVWVKFQGTGSTSKGKRNPSIYAADHEAAGALKAVADDTGCAILAVFHTRKTPRGQADDAGDFLQEVNGTTGLAGAADTIMLLCRTRNSSESVLKVTGRDVPEQEYALSFDAESGLWKMLDTPPVVLDMGDTRHRIFDLLAREPMQAPAMVAAALDIPRDNAKQTLRRMLRDEQLDVIDGHYFVPGRL